MGWCCGVMVWYFFLSFHISWYTGDLKDPKYEAMGYGLNWDLSGRFFPYMGQFLPPVSSGTPWANDRMGTQVRVITHTHAQSVNHKLACTTTHLHPAGLVGSWFRQNWTI